MNIGEKSQDMNPDTSIRPVQRRLLLPLSCVLLLLVSCFLAVLFFNQQRSMRQFSQHLLQDAENSLDNTLMQKVGMFTALIDVFLQNTELHAALKAQDHERLLAVNGPIFQTLQKEYAITHFSFHRPDRVNLVRIHNPGKRGDFIDRFTAREAERSGKVAWGLELEPLGTLILRFVKPIHANGTIIGYLELGQEIDGLLNFLRKRLQVELAMTIHKNTLDRKQWEDGRLALGKNAYWDRYETEVLINSSIAFYPTEFDHFIHGNQWHEHSKLTEDVQFDNKWWRVIALPLKDASGTAVGDLMILRDITTIKADFVWLISSAVIFGLVLLGCVMTFYYVMLRLTDRIIRTQKELLANNEKRYRTVFESAVDGICVTTLEGIILDTNYAYASMMGYTREELVGSPVVNVIHPDYRGRLDASIQQVETSGEVHLESMNIHRDGTPIPVEVHETMIDYGNQSALLGIIRDITERKQAENEIIKSKEEWEKTFNNITDVVTLQDSDMKIFKVNQTGCEIFGLLCDNIIGMHCYELFHGSSEPCPECQLLVTKETFEPYTQEITHEKLGKTFLVSAAPMLDDQGELTHITHVAKDITEKKKIEERLFLNEKLATIAGLAAGVAHEINTPLSAILQSQQLIKMGLDPDNPKNKKLAEECGVDLAKVDTYLEKKNLNFFMKGMRDSAITAGKIIKNLLEFSRPHEGEIRNANLSNILDTTLELARADYDLKRQYDIINVEIVKEYDPELTEVPCVAMEFEQVILNLIKNAVHAMTDNNTENPCITIRTVKTEEIARIEVEDNGPGIGQETQLHIFDPFFTTKDIGQGTGLGLSVSYAIIVDKHRGEIWVESELGEGAKFIIELPLSQK